MEMYETLNISISSLFTFYKIKAKNQFGDKNDPLDFTMTFIKIITAHIKSLARHKAAC